MNIKALMRKIPAFLARSNKSTPLIWSFALLLLIAWFDYVTSVEMSLATFYWIPLALVTWFRGAWTGYWLAAASVGFAVCTDLAGGLAHSHPFFLVWDIATRFLSFAMFVWMLAKIKQLYEEARKATQLQIELESSRTAYRELQTVSYIISHNLHAPLRAITGYTQLALEECSGKVDAQGKEYLKRVQLSGVRMGQLVNALLELVEFSGGEIQREKVDLSAMAGSIAAELNKKNRDRNVAFSVEREIMVYGDPWLLRRALQCLIDNSWKFTAKHPNPRITFGQTKQNGRTVYFVRDNGVGFKMTYANKLFTPFQSLHKQGDFDGIGIGLSIAERIIRRHGGRIWAEGAEGKGASFYFTLESESGVSKEEGELFKWTDRSTADSDRVQFVPCACHARLPQSNTTVGDSYSSPQVLN